MKRPKTTPVRVTVEIGDKKYGFMSQYPLEGLDERRALDFAGQIANLISATHTVNRFEEN